MIPLIERSLKWKILLPTAALLVVFGVTLTSLHLISEHRALSDWLDRAISSGSGIPAEQARALHAEMTAIHHAYGWKYGFIGLAFLGLIFLLALTLAARITEPLARLTRSVQQFAHGDFSATEGLQTASPDEIGALSRAVVDMAGHLRQNVGELKKTKEKMLLFFDQSMDLIGIANYDTRILEVNPAFEKTLQYPRGEIWGRSYLEFVHPDDLEESRRVVRRMSEGENIVAFENRFATRGGDYVRIAWNVVSDPASQSIYAIGRDVTEQRRMEREIVTASEQERERIARDLHDGLGQITTGLAYKAKLIESLLRDGVMPDPAQAAGIVQLANQASNEARALAHGLDPVELRDGLTAALDHLARTTSERFGLPCSFQTDITTDNLDKITSTHLYRIAQEAVNNAIKHSKPGHIGIYLTREERLISLVIIDDGRGLSAHPDTAEGAGLRLMRYRAAMMGGTLHLLPAPAGGLIIKCTVHARA